MAASLPTGILRSMRLHQWVKNVLVFAAPVAAGVIFEPMELVRTCVAFACFCLAASGTYLLNDARDVESDRLHPVKRHRAIASGIVPIRTAVAVGIALIVASLALSFAVNIGADEPSFGLFATMCSYLALTTAYVYRLKFEPVLDVVAVAAGYVLRTIAGATATSVPFSPWFFVVASFGALLMVAGKREGETQELKGDAATIRSTLGVYTPTYLTYLRSVSSGVVLIAYCLWAFESSGDVTSLAVAEPKAVSVAGGMLFKLSIIPFVVAILRYALLLDQGLGSEPEKLVFRDRPLQIAGIIWGMIYASGIYLT
jgi:decaprenyl-phosphate phosphoribosyltransferase